MNNLFTIIGLADPSNISETELRNAIQKLPSEFREVIELHFIQDLSRKEIAARLNCSYSNVHNKITRGVTLLKAKLNPAYFEQMRAVAESLVNSSAVGKESA